MKTQSKFIQSVFAIFFGIVLCSTRFSGKPVFGDGNLKTITRTLGSFNALKIKSSYLNVEVFCNKMPLIEITTDANILHYLTTDISDRTLTLDNEKGYYLIPTKCIIKVSTSFLTKLETFRETKDVTVNGVDSEVFNIKINAGDLTKVKIEGKVEKLNIENSKGAIDAGRLVAKQVKVISQTDKNVEIFASQSLEVDFTGNGNFSFTGNPKILKTNLEEHEKNKLEALKEQGKDLEKMPFIKVKLTNNKSETREFYVKGYNPYLRKNYGYGFKLEAGKSFETELSVGSKIFVNNMFGRHIVTITKQMKDNNVQLK